MTENHQNRIRYLRLVQVFDKALEQCILKLQNWDKVSSCFPAYSKTDAGITHLTNCQKQVTEFWTELSKREFDEILRERDVKSKLDELDDLIDEAKKRLEKRQKDGTVAPGSEIILNDLTAQQLLDYNLYTQRVESINSLDQRLSVLTEMNNELESELKELQEDVKADQDEITELCNRYLGSNLTSRSDEVLTQGLDDLLIQLKEI